jgi:hypothetical protein
MNILPNNGLAIASSMFSPLGFFWRAMQPQQRARGNRLGEVELPPPWGLDFSSLPRTRQDSRARLRPARVMDANESGR